MAIQMRRGRYERFDPTKLVPGEWATVVSGDPHTASGMALYHCYAAGTVQRVATIEDLASMIANVTDDVAAQFTSNLEDAIEDAEAATRAADSAATNANDKAALAGRAASNANDKADMASNAAAIADEKANLANRAAASADTAAQNANAAAAATANVVADAIEALSHETDSEATQISVLAIEVARLKDGYVVISEALYAPASKMTVTSEAVTPSGAAASGENVTLA